MDRLTPALSAIQNLLEGGFSAIDSESGRDALIANTEVEHAEPIRKRAIFFCHFLPLRQRMIALLAETYRKYFKLALAHARTHEDAPEIWAWIQLQPAVGAALVWMREWYILACDGENQSVRQVGSVDFAPGQTVSVSIPTNVPPLSTSSWRAPAWLFGVSIALFGVGRMKEKNVPSCDSEHRLGDAHTRLLFKGARRVFLWALGAAIETVQNEETAAAGAIHIEPLYREAHIPNDRNSSTHRPKGTEGLVQKKSNLSQYMGGLTEKQQMAISLKYEYELGLEEIASRMGITRKTAYEHIKAASKKIEQTRSGEKRRAHGSKHPSE